MPVKSNQLHKIIFSALIVAAIVLYVSTQHFATDKHALDIKHAKTATESQVIRVVDGDTIVVALNHKPETVRLLGINTPETVAPNRSVQCFGPEASARAKELLTDKIVRLETDPSQDNRDKYKRLLRFVFLENPLLHKEGAGGGLNVNESLVRDGYAREYTYKMPYKYQKEFRTEQKLAKKNKRGLWRACP